MSVTDPLHITHAPPLTTASEGTQPRRRNVGITRTAQPTPPDPNQPRALKNLPLITGGTPWSLGGEGIATESKALKLLRNNPGATIDFEAAVEAMATNVNSVADRQALIGLLERKGIDDFQGLARLVNEGDFRDLISMPAHAGANYWTGFGLNNLFRSEIGVAVESVAKHLGPQAANAFAGFFKVAVAAYGTTFGLVALTSGLPQYNPVAPPPLEWEGLWQRNPFHNASLNTPFEEFTLMKGLGDGIAGLTHLDPMKAAAMDAMFSYMAALRRAHQTWSLTEARKLAVLTPIEGAPADGPQEVALVKRKFLDAANLADTERKIDNLQSNKVGQATLWGAGLAYDTMIKLPKGVVTALLSPRSYAAWVSLFPTGLVSHLASTTPDPTSEAYLNMVANSALIYGFMFRNELEKGAGILTRGVWTHQNAERVAGMVTDPVMVPVDQGLKTVGRGVRALPGLAASVPGRAARAVQGLMAHAPNPPAGQVIPMGAQAV